MDIEIFSRYRMWYWQENRSPTMNMTEIPADWVRPYTFIFFGVLSSPNGVDIDDILTAFDELLPIYREVESTHESTDTPPSDNSPFVFIQNNQALPTHHSYTSAEMTVNVDIRHSLIQTKLIRRLTSEYGEGSVSWENPIGGNRIDVVLQNGNKHTFFEIKNGIDARSCVRQALGQLFDYGFWPGRRNADELVVVGEADLDDECQNYIEYLRNEFQLPIHYWSVEI
ncbi:MAG: hypothetical protein PF508_14585 [Spirochaeta sp.]|jgi:hypothetical protein|nr:hypothetical protein [Spirochaeta sp.]